MASALNDMLAETGVPVEKRARLAQSVEGMMSSIVDQAIDKSDTRWEARCEELMTRFMTTQYLCGLRIRFQTVAGHILA